MKRIRSTVYVLSILLMLAFVISSCARRSACPAYSNVDAQEEVQNS